MVASQFFGRLQNNGLLPETGGYPYAKTQIPSLPVPQQEGPWQQTQSFIHGTLNRLLPYLVSSRLPLAVFPAGTVNDFALQTGFTANWEDLARLIRQDRRRAVDLVAVNGRPFAAYASIGFGASVSAMATRTRNIMTPLRQLAPTLVAPLNAALTVFFTRRLGRALLVEDAEGAREALTTGLYVSNLPKLNRVIQLANFQESQGFGAYLLSPRGGISLLRTVAAIQKRKDIAAIRDRVLILSGPRIRFSAIDGRLLDIYADGEFQEQAQSAEFQLLRGALEIFADSSRKARGEGIAGRHAPCASARSDMVYKDAHAEKTRSSWTSSRSSSTRC